METKKEQDIINKLFLATLFIEILFAIISVSILPYGMKLLTLLISITFIWGIYSFLRKKLRYYIAFCVTNLVPNLILINPIFNLKNILEYEKKFILSYIIVMIVCEILFIVITIRIYKYSACTIAGNLSDKYKYSRAYTDEHNNAGNTINANEDNEVPKLLELEKLEKYYKIFRTADFFIYLTSYSIVIMDLLLSLLFYLFFVGDDEGFGGFGDDLELVRLLLNIHNNDIKFAGLFLFLYYIPLIIIIILVEEINNIENKGNKKKDIIIMILFLFAFLIQISICATILYFVFKHKNYHDYRNITEISTLTIVSSVPLSSLILTLIYFRITFKDSFTFLKRYLMFENDLDEIGKYEKV